MRSANKTAAWKNDNRKTNGGKIMNTIKGTATRDASETQRRGGLRHASVCVCKLIALAALAVAFTAIRLAAGSTLTIIHAFGANTSEGYEPPVGVVQGPDGNFYGLTDGGGTVQSGTSYGVVYQMTPTGAITVLHSFPESDGDGFKGPLIFGNDGFLYGTNIYGGTDGGTVFKISTAGAFTTLYRFGFEGANGDGPEDGLTLGPDGNLYGTTGQGAKQGVVFKITPSGAFTKLHEFASYDEQEKPTYDGSYPRAGLVLANDGNLYGTTYDGGTHESGVVFRISLNGDYSIVHNFDDPKGSNPQARLIQASDGKLYGTTVFGGDSRSGTVFSCALDGTFAVVHSFDGNDGQYPDKPLVQAADEFLYGTTAGHGTIFRIALDGSFQTLHYFDSASEGSYPSALIQASDGQFYGALDGDGPQGAGAIFRFTIYPLKLGNISTRIKVGTGNNVMIGGFIITGNEPKKVIVRGIGPSLGIVGQLEDPTLELHDSSGQLIASNDDWQNGPDAQAVMDSGIPPYSSKEAAIVRTLDPGAYTAIVAGAGGTTGVGLVEVYDLSTVSAGKLANISTRGIAEIGDNVIIGGIIVLGESQAKLLIRAIGPSLGIAGQLEDPVLELHNSNGATIASNDDWKSDQQADIEATGVPPSSDAEAALVTTLDPAAYTAIVRGKNNSTGVALVEAYQLSN